MKEKVIKVKKEKSEGCMGIRVAKQRYFRT